MAETHFTVVGMRYRVTPSTLRAMQKRAPLKVEITREPDNSHDQNALAVYVRAETWKNMKIGYLSREVAGELAPRIDSRSASISSAKLTAVDADRGEGTILADLQKLHG